MNRRILVLGVLVLVAGATAVAVASPQPDHVCAACGGAFESAAAGVGYDVNVTNSTATVRVHENGSATWTVTNRLGGADAGVLTDESARTVVREALSSRHGLPHVYEEGSVTIGSVTVDGRTVTATFTDPDAGRKRLGTLVVDYLHTGGIQGGWILNADNFTVLGPPGTVVRNDPAGAITEEYTSPAVVPTVDGRRVTWHGDIGGSFGPVFYEDVYLVFADAGTAGWRVTGATALATAPIWLGNVTEFVVPATLVYLLCLVTVLLLVSGVLRYDPDANSVAAVIASLGGVGIVAALFVPNGRWLLGLGAVYLVTGGGGVVAPRLLRTRRGRVSLGLCSLAGVAVGYTAFSLVTDLETTVGRVLLPVAYSLPVAVGPVLGYALGRTRATGEVRSAAIAVAIAVAAFFVAGAASAPYDSTMFGVALLIYSAGAIVAALAVAPLVLLGARARTAKT